MGAAEAQVFTSKAAEYRNQSAMLMDADDLDTNTTKQIAATVGLVSANMFEGLAMLAAMMGAPAPDPAMERRRAILERNDAIRTAAARGDWDEFDKLVSGNGASGGDGEGGGS